MSAGGAITVSVFEGARYHRVNYGREVEALRRYHRARFVGRHAAAQVLVEHLATGSGYMMLRAPAGRGKTALLVHAIDAFAGQLPVIYHFHRSDVGENSSIVFLQSVNSQLMDFLGVGGGVGPTLMELRPQFSELWSLATQNPLALVVDGLDEVAQEELRAVQLLPAGLGAARVVVSTRPLPDPRTVVPLEHPLRQAKVMDLDPLELTDTQLLISSLESDSLDVAENARRIHDITQGEPLVAHFVAMQVAEHGIAALDDAADSPHASVADYFRHQVAVMREQAPDEAWDLLGVLAVATSPIALETVAEIVEQPQRKILSVRHHVDRYLLPAGREEVTIAHPALREQLTAEFSAHELAGYQESLHRWAHRYSRQDWPSNTPAWLASNWARQLTADDPAALPDLITASWLRLRISTDDGVARGFLADAERALSAASEDGPRLRLALVIAAAGHLEAVVPLDAVEAMTLTGDEELPLRLVAAAPNDSVRRADLLARIGRARKDRGALSAAEAAFTDAAAPVQRSAWSPDEFEAVRIIAEAADAGAVRRLADSVFDGTIGDGLNERAEITHLVLAGLARVGETERVRTLLQRWPDLPEAVVIWGLLGDVDRLVDAERALLQPGSDLFDELTATLPHWFDRRERQARAMAALAQGWANAGQSAQAAEVAAHLRDQTDDLLQASLLLTHPALEELRRDTAVRGLIALETDQNSYGLPREIAVLGRALAPFADHSLLDRADRLARSTMLPTDVPLGWIQSGAVDRGFDLLEWDLHRRGPAAWLHRDGFTVTLREGARCGAADRCEQIARSIPDPLLRSHGVAAVALGIAHLKQPRTSELARDSSRINMELRPTAHTTDILQLATAIAHLDPASPTANHLAQRCLDAFPSRPAFARAPLAELLVAVGRNEDAHDLLMTQNPPPFGHEDASSALALLAQAHARNGKQRSAAQAAEAAEANLGGYRWDSAAWIELATAWRLLGAKKSSSRCLKKAIAAATRIANDGHWDEWTPIVGLVQEALVQNRVDDATAALRLLAPLGWVSTVAATSLVRDQALHTQAALQAAQRLRARSDEKPKWVSRATRYIPYVLRALQPADAADLRRHLNQLVEVETDPRYAARHRLTVAFALSDTDAELAAQTAIQALLEARVTGATEHYAMTREAVPLLSKTRPRLLELHLHNIIDIRSWWSQWP